MKAVLVLIVLYGGSFASTEQIPMQNMQACAIEATRLDGKDLSATKYVGATLRAFCVQVTDR